MPGAASKEPLILSRACTSPQSPISQGWLPPGSGIFSQSHFSICTARLGLASCWAPAAETDDMAGSLHRNDSPGPVATSRNQHLPSRTRLRQCLCVHCALQGLCKPAMLFPVACYEQQIQFWRNFLLHMKAHTVCNFESVVFGVFVVLCFVFVGILFFGGVLVFVLFFFLILSIWMLFYFFTVRLFDLFNFNFPVLSMKCFLLAEPDYANTECSCTLAFSWLPDTDWRSV